jgi:seryl-tRNA synthetase
MTRKILGRCLGTVALAAAALLIARLDVQAAPPEDNKEVSQLLEDIKGQAADLQRDSDELESFTRSDMSWQSHAEELDRIKERINAIGKTISKLQNLRSSASPWQREAIDRIMPVAKKLASNTTAAIEHLNKNPLRINEPQYQQ